MLGCVFCNFNNHITHITSLCSPFSIFLFQLDYRVHNSAQTPVINGNNCIDQPVTHKNINPTTHHGLHLKNESVLDRMVVEIKQSM